MRTSGKKETAGRVGEAVAIAAMGKLMDLTIDRWKACQAHQKTAQERIEALEEQVSALAGRIAILEAKWLPPA